MGKKALFVLILVAFIDAAGFGLVFPLFTAMLFDVKCGLLPPDATDTVRGVWLGVLLSTAPLTQMAVSPFLGKLSDKMGRKPVILFCLGFGVIAYFCAAYYVFQESLVGLFLSRVAIGIPFATFAIVNASISDVSTTMTERGRGFAFLSSAYGSGFAVGPMLGGVLAGNIFFAEESFVRPFIISAFLLVVAITLVFLWLPETRMVREEKNEETLTFMQSIRKIDRRMFTLLTITFLFFFGWAFYSELIPVWWMAHFQLKASEVGLLFGYGSFWLVATCSLFAAPLLRRFHPLILLEICSLLLFVSIWAIFVFNSTLIYFCVYALQNMLAGMLFPVTAVAVSSLASSDNQGKVMGIYASAEGLGMGLSPMCSGLFVGIHCMMPAAIGGLVIFVAWILSRKARKGAAQFIEINK